MNRPFADTLDPRFDVAQASDHARVHRAEFQHTSETEDLLHELRQPLEVIDSLAFYLEMISSDEQVTRNLQTIRSMVVRATRIVEERLHS